MRGRNFHACSTTHSTPAQATDGSRGQRPDGSKTVIASSFQGLPFNRPNDIVVKSDGCIYVTDPWTQPESPGQFDMTYAGVYRVTPDLGTITLLVNNLIVPNGLAFSPDESVL